MLREAYTIQEVEHGVPEIVKTPITNMAGTSWREAKKQLRRWYLEQAAALRQVTKQQYFGE